MLKIIRGLLEYQPTMEEKTLVWERMIGFRGLDRGSALIGTSSRNQRIERLWRDVFRCFGDVFYYTFKSMEESGLLDVTNPLHLSVLHYVYLPRINAAIDSFVEAWNKHPKRTERNWSVHCRSQRSGFGFTR